MLSKIGKTWVSMLIIISKFGLQVAQSQPSVVVHIYNPTPGNLRQEDHYKSEVSLDYLTRQLSHPLKGIIQSNLDYFRYNRNQGRGCYI